MAITDAELEHLKLLARLEISTAEAEKVRKDLSEVLAYFSKLQEIDTSNVEPLAHVVELRSVLREDAVRPSLPPEAVRRLAVEKEAGFFVVPRILE